MGEVSLYTPCSDPHWIPEECEQTVSAQDKQGSSSGHSPRIPHELTPAVLDDDGAVCGVASENSVGDVAAIGIWDIAGVSLNGGGVLRGASLAWDSHPCATFCRLVGGGVGVAPGGWTSVISVLE